MKWRPSLILSVSVQAVVPIAIVLGVFLLFAGHNAPGGGFVGGLVLGAALVLRYVDGGIEAVDEILPVSSPVLLGVGLVVATATAAAGMLGGGELLESAKFEVDLPVVGTVKTTSALVFDIGVDIVVVGLVSLGLRSLGGQEAP